MALRAMLKNSSDIRSVCDLSRGGAKPWGAPRFAQAVTQERLDERKSRDREVSEVTRLPQPGAHHQGC